MVVALLPSLLNRKLIVVILLHLSHTAIRILCVTLRLCVARPGTTRRDIRTLLHRRLVSERPRVFEGPLGALVALLQSKIDRLVLLGEALELCHRDECVGAGDGRSELVRESPDFVVQGLDRLLECGYLGT